MPVLRKYRRETSEISCCLKYMLFTSNVAIWMIGLCVLAIGIWAWNEKDMFSNLAKLTFIALDPAFVLICIGTITFIIGFTGSVGALRENTCLLAAYAILLSILLLLEISFGVLAFILKDKGWIKDQATEGLRAFIIHYREDPDQQNLIDWIQEDWLQCCGIEGPTDWESNNYFNCSSGAVGSREACGVPFSCCRRRAQEFIKNKQCGYDVRKKGYPVERHIYERGCLRAGEDWLETHLISVALTCIFVLLMQSADVSKIIYEKGCVTAGEEWMEHNLILISTSAIISVFMQILGICFAQNLRADIYAQKSKWH
ncbi:tetraspanin-5 isoform X1 [Teleopsis dalmanni]|uniref:tetraspanin-5 isoform X1 n=1 Tax=Teleopsis dalmanni TaxID=139649 RepID=UPI0018CD131B|nr:tetraspanin-5 isoform X1 [Teleopsis dalmanni]